MNMFGYDVDFILVITTVVVMMVLAITGCVYGNWQPFCLGFIIVGICLILFDLYLYLEDYIPSRKGKVLNHIPGVNVNVHCTQYVFKTFPFFIEFHDVCMAKIYRGNDLVISLPEGVQNICIRRGELKFHDEVTITEGCKLYMTSNNKVFSEDQMVPIEYHISDHVDEEEEIRSYNEILDYIKSISRTGLEIEIPSFIGLIWMPFEFGIF